MVAVHEHPDDVVRRDLAAAYDAIVKVLNGATCVGDFAGVHMKLVQCLMRCHAAVSEDQRTPPAVVQTWPPYMGVRDAMGVLAVALEAYDAAIKALPTNQKR